MKPHSLLFDVYHCHVSEFPIDQNKHLALNHATSRSRVCRINSARKDYKMVLIEKASVHPSMTVCNEGKRDEQTRFECEGHLMKTIDYIVEQT